MNLQQLHYFSVLADTLNFHKAAERLGMSQPPLTVAIRKLETELGVSLFERHPRGVSLTDTGMAALVPARKAIAEATSVREAAHLGAIGHSGQLTVGFVGSAVNELLPRTVSLFRKQYPLVDLALEEMTSADAARHIASGKIDVGLVRLPIMDSTSVMVDVVERDTLVAALPVAWEISAKGMIDLGELADQPFILFKSISVLNATVRMACQQAGFVPRVAQEAIQVQTILSLVHAGLGVALVPAKTARFVPEGVVLSPLTSPVAIEMGIARAEGKRALVENLVAVTLATVDT